MSSKKKMRIDSVMELTKAITYLENLVESIKAGRVEVQTGDETITLNPAQVVEFEMELSRKKDKEKMSFEMSWKKDPRLDEETDLQIG